jgi:hypothetical protein
MRMVRNVVRLTAVVLASAAPLASAAAQVVQYYTTGTFNCAGCTGSGTSAATFGDLTLRFVSPFGAATPAAAATAANPASVDLGVLNPSNASFGFLQAVGGSRTAQTLNGTFTLNIFQVAPSGGSSSLVGTLSGQLAGSASNAMFMANSNTVTIGDISYRYKDLNYSLVPATTNNGMVSLQGEISGPPFSGGPGGTVVPEPATVTLLGAGLALTGLIAARRKRTTV